MQPQPTTSRRRKNTANSPGSISEAAFSKQIQEIFALDGWRVFRMEPVSRREWGRGFGEMGMADLLAIRYEPERDGDTRADVLWVEVKRPGAKAAPHQRHWIAAERACGALVLLAGKDFPATFEGFTAWYRGSGLMRRAGLC